VVGILEFTCLGLHPFAIPLTLLKINLQYIAPPESIEFSAEPIKHEEKILVSYRIHKVYPLPVITIYQSCLEVGRRPGPVKQEEEDDDQGILFPMTSNPVDSSLAMEEEEKEDDEAQREARKRILERKRRIKSRKERHKEDGSPFVDQRDASVRNEDPKSRTNDEDDDTLVSPVVLVHPRESRSNSRTRMTKMKKNKRQGRRQEVNDGNKKRRKSIRLRMEWVPQPTSSLNSSYSLSQTPKTKILIHESKEWFVTDNNPVGQQDNAIQEESQDNLVSEDATEEETDGTTSFLDEEDSHTSSSLVSDKDGQAVYTLQHVQFMDMIEVLDNYRQSGCFLPDGNLRTASPVIFELKLAIPSTDFVVRKSIEYFPGEFILT